MKTFTYHNRKVTTYMRNGSLVCDVEGTYIRAALWSSVKDALDFQAGIFPAGINSRTEPHALFAGLDASAS
jgi:hypothetical protein